MCLSHFYSSRAPMPVGDPFRKSKLQGKGLFSLYVRPALVSFPSSFLCIYLIFALFAAKGVWDDETLCWACDQQEQNQC